MEGGKVLGVGLLGKSRGGGGGAKVQGGHV